MILITAFEKFGPFDRNPTIDIANALKDYALTEIVPVTFKDARKIPLRFLKKEDVDGVLCMGFAPSRSKITVEAVALNIMHSKFPDNDGFVPQFEKVYDDGPPAYINLKTAEKFVAALQNVDLPVRISYSAGTYVCNTLYYSFLYQIDALKLGIPAIFIHFPPDEKLAQNQNTVSHISLSKMIAAAKTAIEVFDTLDS